MQSDSRIEEMRREVDSEREKLSALDRQVSDSERRKLLQQAKARLDEAEGFLLPHGLKANTAHEETWINQAEARLHMAVRQRELLQEKIAPYRLAPIR